MKTLKVKASTVYGRKRYEPADELSTKFASLIQRDSKHPIMFTTADIERIKSLGYTVKVAAEEL